MKRILIVDDSNGWLEHHKSILEKLIPTSSITMACCAKEGYNKILENTQNPFDIIITDLQMEDDFSPQYAGEWLIEQIKNLNKYYKSKIVIISGTYNIRYIAEKYGVECIPKNTALNFPDSYDMLKE